MIIQLITLPIFSLFNFIVDLLPSGSDIPSWDLYFISLIQKALYFFPADVLVILLGNVIFWLVALNGWAIIEWVYKKLPGIS